MVTHGKLAVEAHPLGDMAGSILVAACNSAAGVTVIEASLGEGRKVSQGRLPSPVADVCINLVRAKPPLFAP